MKTLLTKIYSRSRTALLFLGVITAVSSVAMPAYAGNKCGGGSGEEGVKTSIDIGCLGRGNPIADMAFAIIKILSDGVGLIVIASIVFAGIQYASSQGDPQASAAAQNRIRSAVTALLIYIFAYAILNYVLPNGFLR